MRCADGRCHGLRADRHRRLPPPVDRCRRFGTRALNRDFSPGDQIDSPRPDRLNTVRGRGSIGIAPSAAILDCAGAIVASAIAIIGVQGETRPVVEGSPWPPQGTSAGCTHPSTKLAVLAHLSTMCPRCGPVTRAGRGPGRPRPALPLKRPDLTRGPTPAVRAERPNWGSTRHRRGHTDRTVRSTVGGRPGLPTIDPAIRLTTRFMPQSSSTAPASSTAWVQSISDRRRVHLVVAGDPLHSGAGATREVGWVPKRPRGHPPIARYPFQPRTVTGVRVKPGTVHDGFLTASNAGFMKSNVLCG